VPIQAVVVRELSKDGEVIERGEAPRNPGEAQSEQPRNKGEEQEGLFLVVDREARFKPVKTGIVGETEIEIVEGLAGGEEIVTGSYKTLRTLKDKSKIKLEEQKHGGRS
jgi:HlyD family secretion protein